MLKSKNPDNPLDCFIRDALKSPDSDLHPVDWSEVEVLLRHEQKSISAGAGKKIILVSGAAVIIVTGAVGIFKIIQYYSSLPAETETLINSAHSTFNAVDTQKIIATDSASFVIDTAKIDSAVPIVIGTDEAHKTDSILAASAIFLKKINDKQPPAAPNQDRNKKQKQSNAVKNAADTSSVKIMLESPPADTASSHAVREEIKPELPPPLPDTSNTSAPSKKSKKNKKQKNTSADSSKVRTGAPSGTKYPLKTQW